MENAGFIKDKSVIKTYTQTKKVLESTLEYLIKHDKDDLLKQFKDEAATESLVDGEVKPKKKRNSIHPLWETVI